MDNTVPAHPIARLRQLEGGEFLLYPGRSVRLGRSIENDVVIADPKVSRFHALFEWNGSGFSVRDLGSSNGTYVNDERVLGNAPLALRDGDQVTIHRRVLVYEIVRVESSQPVSASLPAPAPAAAQPRPRGPRLDVRQGPDAGCTFPLWGERITIGRAGPDALYEIRLADDSLSRPHARIELRDDGYYLLDLESAGGTFLNGARLFHPARLRPGDEIVIGGTCLVFYHKNDQPVV